MLTLDQVIAGAKLRGLAGATPVEVVRAECIGFDTLNVRYPGADRPAEVLLFRNAETRVELVEAGQPVALIVTGRHSKLPRMPTSFGIRTA
jgi:hypothetical protein